MTNFNYGRPEPPRPGLSTMTHPQGSERPYVHVTEKEKARRAAERRKEDRKRGFKVIIQYLLSPITTRMDEAGREQ